MDRETLLALLEKNKGAKIIDIDEWGVLDNSPEAIKRLEDFKQKFLRRECFPPGMEHWMPDEYKDLPPKD